MIGIAISFVVAITCLLAVKWVLAEVRREKGIIQSASNLLVSIDLALKHGYPAAVALLEIHKTNLLPEPAPDLPAIPDELQRLIDGWPDAWAREGAEKYAKNLYKTELDWSKVYQRMLTETSGQ